MSEKQKDKEKQEEKQGENKKSLFELVKEIPDNKGAYSVSYWCGQAYTYDRKSPLSVVKMSTLKKEDITPAQKETRKEKPYWYFVNHYVSVEYSGHLPCQVVFKNPQGQYTHISREIISVVDESGNKTEQEHDNDLYIVLYWIDENNPCAIPYNMVDVEFIGEILYIKIHDKKEQALLVRAMKLNMSVDTLQTISTRAYYQSLPPLDDSDKGKLIYLWENGHAQKLNITRKLIRVMSDMLLSWDKDNIPKTVDNVLDDDEKQVIGLVTSSKKSVVESCLRNKDNTTIKHVDGSLIQSELRAWLTSMDHDKIYTLVNKLKKYEKEYKK